MGDLVKMENEQSEGNFDFNFFFSSLPTAPRLFGHVCYLLSSMYAAIKYLI